MPRVFTLIGISTFVPVESAIVMVAPRHGDSRLSCRSRSKFAVSVNVIGSSAVKIRAASCGTRSTWLASSCFFFCFFSAACCVCAVSCCATPRTRTRLHSLCMIPPSSSVRLPLGDVHFHHRLLSLERGHQLVSRHALLQHDCVLDDVRPVGFVHHAAVAPSLRVLLEQRLHHQASRLYVAGANA